MPTYFCTVSELQDVMLSGESARCLRSDFVLHFGTGAKKSSLRLRSQAFEIVAGNSSFSVTLLFQFQVEIPKVKAAGD